MMGRLKSEQVSSTSKTLCLAIIWFVGSMQLDLF
jgi:hypothetical protein